MLDGGGGSAALALPERLPEAAKRAAAALASIGVHVAGQVFVCRLDLAAELAFHDAADGIDHEGAAGDRALAAITSWILSALLSASTTSRMIHAAADSRCTRWTTGRSGASRQCRDVIPSWRHARRA